MEIQHNSGSSMYDQEQILRMKYAESTWTREEDKLFEIALVHIPENIPTRWEEIAKAVPGKTAEQVRVHYEVLLHDLDAIDSGQVEIPNYVNNYNPHESFVSSNSESRRSQINFRATGKKPKKGTPWTPEEHSNFLKGLDLFGKGDWRSISRNCVITRTPTQVASHAQKYFLRQSCQKKEKRRISIHDSTTDKIPVDAQPPPPSTANIYNDQGGSGGGGGRAPPQMGYEYQENFGHPNY